MTNWTPEAIRALKSQLGMSYRQMGEACEVDARTVRYWTAKDSKPPNKWSSHQLDLLAMRAARKDAGK